MLSAKDPQPQTQTPASQSTAQQPVIPDSKQQQQIKRQSLRERLLTLQQLIPSLNDQSTAGCKTEAVILQKSTTYSSYSHDYLFITFTYISRGTYKSSD